MGGPWKYACNSSVLSCTVCGGMGYIVRWPCCHYILDVLCAKCWSWASRTGLS